MAALAPSPAANTTSTDRTDVGLLAAQWADYTTAVKIRARGNWLSIFNALAPKLAGPIKHLGVGCPCPMHGGKDGFRLFNRHEPLHAEGGSVCNSCGVFKSGASTLSAVNNWSIEEAIKQVGAFLDMPWGHETTGIATRSTLAGPEQVEMTEAEYKNDLRLMRSLNDLIRNSEEVNWGGDCPVVKYMRFRGLQDILRDPPSDIRLVRKCDYWVQRAVVDENGAEILDADGVAVTKPEKYGAFPLLLGIMRDVNGDICGAQRIWITEDGRNPFEGESEEFLSRNKRKKRAAVPSWLRMVPGAVRLYPGAPTLGTGEGIETVLGARLLMEARQMGRKVAVWAAVDAVGLEKFQAPDYVNDLLIFGDNDDPVRSRVRKNVPYGRGEDAARRLRDRMLDRGGARIYLPPKVDTDWLDVWNALSRRDELVDQRFEGALRLGPDHAEGGASEREVAPERTQDPEPEPMMRAG